MVAYIVLCISAFCSPDAVHVISKIISHHEVLPYERFGDPIGITCTSFCLGI